MKPSTMWLRGRFTVHYRIKHRPCPVIRLNQVAICHLGVWRERSKQRGVGGFKRDTKNKRKLNTGIAQRRQDIIPLLLYSINILSGHLHCLLHCCYTPPTCWRDYVKVLWGLPGMGQDRLIKARGWHSDVPPWPWESSSWQLRWIPWLNLMMYNSVDTQGIWIRLANDVDNGVKTLKLISIAMQGSLCSISRKDISNGRLVRYLFQDREMWESVKLWWWAGTNFVELFNKI
jgi:hypothetical protein